MEGVSGALERSLAKALSAGDGAEAARIYMIAAGSADEAGKRDQAAFLLTHAWVHSLEAGSDLADECRTRLAQADRV